LTHPYSFFFSFIDTPPQDNIQNTYLGGILIGVAFLNAFIKFYQLQKSEAMASFLAMIPPSYRVLRDGTLQNIPAAHLVKGNVVLLVDNHSVLVCLPPSDPYSGSASVTRCQPIFLFFPQTISKSTTVALLARLNLKRGPNHKGSGYWPVEAENLVSPVVLSQCRRAKAEDDAWAVIQHLSRDSGGGAGISQQLSILLASLAEISPFNPTGVELAVIAKTGLGSSVALLVQSSLIARPSRTCCHSSVIILLILHWRDRSTSFSLDATASGRGTGRARLT
jgi:hypothetical protein